jgi:large subunit ribosomal protein L10
VILSQMQLAAQQAFNLSVNAAIPTKDTVGAILAKAVREARGLAVEAAIYEKDVVDAIIGKAYRESQALSGLVK